MSKIQTGDIIARSYRFAFGGFFRVLGIIWLPLALELAAVFFLMVPMFGAFGQMLAHLPQAHADGMPPEISEAMNGIYRYAILLMVIGLFLRAVMMLGITQEALGMRKGVPFVYFAIGKDVWRLFGAYFILYVLMQIAVLVIVLVIAIPAVIVGIIAATMVNASHLSHAAIGGLTAFGIVALVVLIYGAIIYVALRLGFLLTPIVVVEKSISIERIWNLSKGNAWRFFLVMLAIVLPIVFVYMIAMIAIFFQAAWPALAAMSHEGHVPAAVVSAHMSAFIRTLMSAWVVFVPVMIVFTTILCGLAGSASAFAYRALVPPPKPAAQAG